MAALNMAFEHGQAWKVARANFETGITRPGAKFGMWIRKVEWNEERTSARLTGTGYDVLLLLDATKVYATGSTTRPRKSRLPVERSRIKTMNGWSALNFTG